MNQSFKFLKYNGTKLIIFLRIYISEIKLREVQYSTRIDLCPRRFAQEYFLQLIHQSV